MCSVYLIIEYPKLEGTCMDHQCPTSGHASNRESNGSIDKSCYRTKIKYNNKSELSKKNTEWL